MVRSLISAKRLMNLITGHIELKITTDTRIQSVNPDFQLCGMEKGGTNKIP